MNGTREIQLHVCPVGAAKVGVVPIQHSELVQLEYLALGVHVLENLVLLKASLFIGVFGMWLCVIDFPLR